MNQIKQVLLLHQQGVSNRQIARELGKSKRYNHPKILDNLQNLKISNLNSAREQRYFAFGTWVAKADSLRRRGLR